MIHEDECKEKVWQDPEDFCSIRHTEFYIGGIVIIVSMGFVIVLEICSMFSIVNKILDGPKYKSLKFLCILRYNFLFILGPCLFWLFSTGTAYTIFSKSHLEPTWGVGWCCGASLACLLIRLHY